ncbi:MAG TPA: NfeD family protein [Solirubrobacterales bacterium]|nr:NfeD family protein [Solirubrobacterales bacterium]
MEFFVVIAAIGVALLLAELLLPTGGVLAVLGGLGLTAAGVLALDSNAGERDVIGPALIVLGLLSIVSFYFIARKVVEAHRDQPVRTGAEELVGSHGEARTTLDPEGQVWVGGALWRARVAGGGERVGLGDRVTVDEVDGLTLVVSPDTATAGSAGEGAS